MSNTDDAAADTATLSNERARYLKLYSESVVGFIEAFLDNELQAKTMQGVPKKALVYFVFVMMTTIAPPVLEALLAGDLPARIARDQDLEKVLEKTKSRVAADERLPGIYGNFLVNDLNLSPTRDELFELVAKVEEYTFGDDWRVARHVESRILNNRLDDDQYQAGRRQCLCPAADEGNPRRPGNLSSSSLVN